MHKDEISRSVKAIVLFLVLAAIMVVGSRFVR